MFSSLNRQTMMAECDVITVTKDCTDNGAICYSLILVKVMSQSYLNNIYYISFLLLHFGAMSLYSVQCTCICILYIVYCIMCIVYCILYIVYCILYFVFCITICICIYILYFVFYICILNLYFLFGVLEVKVCPPNLKTIMLVVIQLRIPHSSWIEPLSQLLSKLWL